MDACHKAQEKGCDVLKQWDATLDGNTRESHSQVDGEIRELDKPFSNGLMFPGDPSGEAAEVINCRCALLQRASWELDEDELEELKERAEFFGLDKTASFEEYKQKYLKAAESQVEDVTSGFVPAKTVKEAEEYTQRFVSEYKSKYSGNVSFRGMDVEHANKVNKVLTEFYDRFGVERHDNITVMNFREKKWADAVDKGVCAAYRWGGNGGTLYVNQKLMGNAKAVAALKKKTDDLLATVLSGADRVLESPTLAPRKRAYIEALVKSGRQCISQSAPDFVEATIVHELGHSLDEKVFRKYFKTLSNKEGLDIQESMERYGASVSGYAVTLANEYIAESFTAWWYGMADILDPALVRIFEGALK
jgi:hypothetical protein